MVTVPTTLVDSVLTFTGAGEFSRAQAQEHAEVVAEMAHAYTRGNGFDETTGLPDGAIAKVIVAATARLLANPDQARYQIGAVAIYTSFEGWSRIEKTILSGYRTRSV